MEYSLIRVALWVFALVLCYAILARGLFNFAEPFRLNAMAIAEKLANSSQVSDRKKYVLYQSLGEVYSRWYAWKLLGLLVFVLVTLPFRKGSNALERDREGIPAHFESDWRRFHLYWMVSTVSNEPAAAFLFSVLSIVTLACFASMSAISMALSIAAGTHHNHHRPNATT